MPETREIVINTGPIIALVAGLGSLEVLQMYHRVYVPFEVSQELLVNNQTRFAAREFAEAHWLEKGTAPLEISPYLLNSLDLGESSVIQAALNMNIHTVCIDEMAGRRIARLNGLQVTGSVGILLRAKREGHLDSVRAAMGNDRRPRTLSCILSLSKDCRRVPTRDPEEARESKRAGDKGTRRVRTGTRPGDGETRR